MSNLLMMYVDKAAEAGMNPEYTDDYCLFVLFGLIVSALFFIGIGLIILLAIKYRKKHLTP